MFLKFWNTKCVSVKTPVMPSVTTSNLSVKIESIIVSSYWITGNASIPLFYLKSKGSLSTSLSALPNWVYYRGKSNCLYIMETCIRSFLGTESLRLQMGFSLMQIVPSPNLQQLKVLCCLFWRIENIALSCSTKEANEVIEDAISEPVMPDHSVAIKHFVRCIWEVLSTKLIQLAWLISH